MPERREIMWVGGILALLVAGLFADRWLSGSSIYFSIVEEGFPIAANYPWDRFAARCLAAGRFPLWNPYQSCGNAFIANYLPAFFFFPRWIMYLSDGVAVRDFYVLLRFWLGGLFLYIFLKRISLKIPGAALATVAFITGGYFTRYYNENYLNIDLLLGLWLFAGEELVRRKSLGATIGAGLAILAIVLGGHPEAAFHALGIMTLWVFWRSFTINRGGAASGAPTVIILFLAASVAAGVAASAQIVPFLEALSQSTNYHLPNLGRFHYQLKDLASLAYPEIYGILDTRLWMKIVPPVGAGASYAVTTINWLPYHLGFITLLFAGVALLKLSKTNRNAFFFGIYFLVGLGGVFGIPPFNAVFALPPLSMLGNYKHLFPELTLCAAILAGMGLDTILAVERRERVATLLLVMIGLLALGFYAVHKSQYPAYPLVIMLGCVPSFGILISSLPKSKKQSLYLMTIAALLLCYIMAQGSSKLYHAKDQSDLLDMQSAPFVTYLKDHIGDDRYTSLYPPMFPAFATLNEIAEVRGLDALHSKAFWNLLMQVNGPDIHEVTTYFYKSGAFAPFPDALWNPLLNDVRLRYIISPGDLGGMLATQAVLRHASVRAISNDYFHWGVWDKGQDRRPVLYTHPPIQLDINFSLPNDTEKLEMSIGWDSCVSGEKRDGAFVLIREDREGEQRTVYARYLPPDEMNWVAVPLSVFPAPGVKRTVIINPLANTKMDWLGWGIKNTTGDFWGYTLAFPGEIAVYEKPAFPPLFSLAKSLDAPAGDAFPARRIAADEYIFDATPHLPLLTANGFNYRPGWRLFGEREIKINVTKPFKFYSDFMSRGAKIGGPYRLIYIPWGFKVGIWVSIGSLLSFALLILKRQFRQFPPVGN